MKRHRLLFVAALCVVSLLPASAADVFAQAGAWEKPYDQWTLKEVEQILTDSPWAQTRSKGVSLSVGDPLFSAGANPDTEGVLIRLRSSPVVRLAVLRHRQIKEKFDKMDERARAAFMEKNRLMLECQPCRENYVVTLGPPPGTTKGVPSALRLMTLAALKQSIRLVDERGRRRELVHFDAPKADGDEATFFFARADERGEPLLTTASKTLAVTLDPAVFGTSAIKITRIEFDVPKLILKGAVMF
jgi:hypothetical protein